MSKVHIDDAIEKMTKAMELRGGCYKYKKDLPWAS